jgi:hypothetical protein
MGFPAPHLPASAQSNDVIELLLAFHQALWGSLCEESRNKRVELKLIDPAQDMIDRAFPN